MTDAALQLSSITKTRLEAFSDGVLAIILTIMVLALEPPKSMGWEHLGPFLNTLLSYVLSFALIVIYWGNHHHLLHTATRVNSRLIWSNAHLLFWLSLVPFATKWMGDSAFERTPVIIYAGLCTLCALAFTILQQVIILSGRFSDRLLLAMKRQAVKGTISTSVYIASIGFAFIDTRISEVLFVGTAVMWIVPDKNIEKALEN